jgi:hypothetical protein
VSAAGDSPRPEDRPARRPDAGRLGRLAAELGLDLPPFDGPLVVFDPSGRRRAGDPLYMGGDLHAVHARPPAPGDPPRDDTLDEATITLTLGDFQEDTVETVAVGGVWCVGLHDVLLDSPLYLMIRDRDGRLRAWLLLPPPISMLGEGGLWLPSVPPLSDVA